MSIRETCIHINIIILSCILYANVFQMSFTSWIRWLFLLLHRVLGKLDKENKKNSFVSICKCYLPLFSHIHYDYEWKSLAWMGSSVGMGICLMFEILYLIHSKIQNKSIPLEYIKHCHIEFNDYLHMYVIYIIVCINININHIKWIKFIKVPQRDHNAKHQHWL